MIHINLLPIRQIKQRLQVRNEIAAFFVLIGIVVMLIGSFATGQLLTINGLKNENKTLTAKKASYQGALNEIEELKKAKKEQETKLDVIKKLKTGSQVTVHLMDVIAKIFPANRLWLTSMQQNETNLDISGVALDNATIAQFMQSINDSKSFSGVQLSQTQQTTISGAKLKSFTLKITIPPSNKPTTSTAAVEEKK